MKRRTLIYAAGFLAASSFTHPAVCQPRWPTKAIKIIVPAPAGGPFDRTIRPLAQKMSESLNQPVVVENRPSAGNIVGTQAGAAAAADGYTLTMTGMLNTIAASLYENIPFDIVSDFQHIGGIGEGAQWLVVRGDSEFASLSELIAQARRQPGKLNYASSGAGSSGHLVMELLQRATGAQLTHVPYKGAAPALQDVLGGVVSIIVLPISAAQLHVQSGRLRVLAASSPNRDPRHGSVPTFSELGLPQLTVSSWVGLSAPKGTPVEVIRQINEALNAGLNAPELLKLLEAEGMTALQTTPEQFTDLVRSDTNRWGQLVRTLNIKAN